MPDAPVVTVTNPNDPGDLLVAGDERAPRRVPQRVKVLASTAVVLALVGTAGTSYALDRRAENRRGAAAFVIADTVHATVTLQSGDPLPGSAEELFITDPVTGLDLPQEQQPLPQTGKLHVSLLVADAAGEALTEIRSVEVRGTGITTELINDGTERRFPGSSEVGLLVDAVFPCSEVAAGRYPVLTGVEVTLVPESGAEHRITLPLSSTPPELALAACGLPDPAAVPVVMMEEQVGRLLVEVQSIERSRSPLRLVSITSPGFALALVSPDPRVLPSTSVLHDVNVRVTDCALARAGNLVVTVTMRDGQRTFTVVAADSEANPSRRPGSSRLRTAIERACP